MGVASILSDWGKDIATVLKQNQINEEGSP